MLAVKLVSASSRQMGWPISDIDSGLWVSDSILIRADTESKLFCLAIMVSTHSYSKLVEQPKGGEESVYRAVKCCVNVG